MPRLVSLLMLLVVCASGWRLAQGAERVGDALVISALHDRTEVVAVLEESILALIDRSPHEDRFDLYRTYNQLMGTWVQVELSQALVDDAAAATSPSEEEAIRTTLHDQAQFALWELDDALAYLERNRSHADRGEYLRIIENIRSLLSETNAIMRRLLACCAS